MHIHPREEVGRIHMFRYVRTLRTYVQLHSLLLPERPNDVWYVVCRLLFLLERDLFIHEMRASVSQKME